MTNSLARLYTRGVAGVETPEQLLEAKQLLAEAEDECEQHRQTIAQLEQLLHEQRERAEKLLYVLRIVDQRLQCPVCLSILSFSGHSSWCQLAAVLADQPAEITSDA